MMPRSVSRGGGLRPIAALLVLAMVAMSFIVAAPASAVIPTYIKYHEDQTDAGIWIQRGEFYQYGLVEFTNNQRYIITGVHLTYATNVKSLWKGELEIRENSTDSTLIKNLNVPFTMDDRDETVYHETFNGPEFMVVNNMFSMALWPASNEVNPLKLYYNVQYSQSTGHSYLMANDGEGWVLMKDSSGYWEWVLSAMVEPVSDLEVGGADVGGTMDSVDNLDAYEVLLVGGKTYSFNIANPKRNNFVLRVYEPASVIKDPLAELQSIGESQILTFVPPDDGFYFVVMEYPNNMASTLYGLNVTSNMPPVAVIEGDDIVNVNQTARFTAENSTDEDGDSLSYSWDFDASDGIKTDASKKSPSNVYRKAGTYVVTLTVSDGKESNTTTHAVRVNAPPTGSFVVDGSAINRTTRFNFDQEYTFTASFTDPDKDALTYEWDFGDGTTGTGAEARHTFEQEGNFTLAIRLTVRDPATSVVVEEEMTFNQLPETSIKELDTTARAGSKVTITGYGRDVDGEIVEFRWDFESDGVVDKVTEDPYVDHKFKKVGTYNVTFQVVDNNGGIGVDSMAVEVKPAKKEEQDMTGVYAGVGVLVVVVVIVVVLFLFRGRLFKSKDDGEVGVGEGGAAAQPPPAQQAADGAGKQPQLQPQQQQPQQQQQQMPPPKPGQPPKDAGPRLVPPPKPGQQSAQPKLIPPPKPGQKSAPPRLVPPPKPPS